MKYLVLYPPDDKDIKSCMDHWLSEAGGSLSFEEVSKKFAERFKYFYCEVRTPEDLEKLKEFFVVKCCYGYKDGIVFLPN